MNVTITPQAEQFIRRMITFNGGSENSGFRLAVKAGGCSGLTYDFSIEPQPLEGDAVIEGNGIKVFIPEEYQSFLDGVVVGCEDSLMHTSLTFSNPNAAASCGCGTSFAPQ